MTAMWNLNGSDIQKAKEQLEARRTTLKAEYEEAVKRIDAELADIETIEHVAETFVTGKNGSDPMAQSVGTLEKSDDDSSEFAGRTVVMVTSDRQTCCDSLCNQHAHHL